MGFGKKNAFLHNYTNKNTRFLSVMLKICCITLCVQLLISKEVGYLCYVNRKYSSVYENNLYFGKEKSRNTQ